jgi:hypothetical protein
MRVDSPTKVLEPGQTSVRVGPADISPEEQQRVEAEVARLESLTPDALAEVVKTTLEIGGVIRLAAIEQLSQTNSAVSQLIHDVRSTPAPTSMGRGDEAIDTTLPDARVRLGGKSNNTAVKLGL